MHGSLRAAHRTHTTDTAAPPDALTFRGAPRRARGLVALLRSGMMADDGLLVAKDAKTISVQCALYLQDSSKQNAPSFYLQDPANRTADNAGCSKPN